MADRSLYERLAAVTAELGEITEELSTATYRAIEAETLKRVAIAAGVDHTTDSTLVIVGLGDALQRERDVVRELRRRIAALERAEDERRRASALVFAQEEDPDGRC